MFKKIILTSAILASTSTLAFADPAPYVAAGTGIVVSTANENWISSSRGMPLNVALGYGGVINQNFYVAGELNGTLATANLDDNGSYLKTTYGYGASILPGLMLSEHTLAFARLGVVKTRFSDLDETKTGAQLGLGLQTGLTQHLDLRGEYNFSTYQHFNVTNAGTSYSVTPHTDAFLLSLVYKFD